MQHFTTDILIIGGGINGAGIAADAAHRGLSVILCEKDDLASSTSSASTKLIHGGLRYLEQYDFKLVHDALKEREILLKKAPHLIHPLKFVLPYESHLRPAWMIRLGLFLYDHLAKRSLLPASGKLNLRKTQEGTPLKPEFKIGFSYFDCQTDDARLVVANALSAQNNGAKIFTRTACVSAKRNNSEWTVELLDKHKNETILVTAKAVVNATGPWVSEVLHSIFKGHSESHVELIQGSHIVVPKLYDGDHAYILQNKDQRIIFAIPYQNHFTLIGTTDVPFSGNPNQCAISEEEIEYLCKTITDYFSKPISPKDIVWYYSGVRPLYDTQSHTASKMSREYHLEIEDENNKAPLLSVFGGKITTFRTLAEHALEKLKPYFPAMKKTSTENIPLPGGDIANASFSEFLTLIEKKYAWLPKTLLVRYAKNYGTLIEKVIGNAARLEDLGEHFGADLYEKEIIYLIENEWAKTLQDIIWRRTKLGLELNKEQKKKITEFLAHL